MASTSRRRCCWRTGKAPRAPSIPRTAACTIGQLARALASSAPAPTPKVFVTLFVSLTADNVSEPHDPWQQARLPVVQRVECLDFPLTWHKRGDQLQHAFEHAVHQFDRDRVNYWHLPAYT